jgi:hypothetical protein
MAKTAVARHGGTVRVYGHRGRDRFGCVALVRPQGNRAVGGGASLAIGSAAASGAVFGYGLARWPDIVAFGPNQPAGGQPSRAADRAGLILVAVSTVMSAISTDTEALTMPTHRAPPGDVAALAASPVAAGLAVIREQACHGGHKRR